MWVVSKAGDASPMDTQRGLCVVRTHPKAVVPTGSRISFMDPTLHFNFWAFFLALPKQHVECPQKLIHPCRELGKV